MGCVSSNQVKNPKKYTSNKNQNQKHIQPALYKSKLAKSIINKSTIKNQEPHPINLNQQQLPKNINQQHLPPKIKKITSKQFLSQWQIIQTLNQSTRMQGPKLIQNKIDGTIKVMRVYPNEQSSSFVSDQRIKTYHKILRFDLYKDQQENWIIIDQYCSGQNVFQILADAYPTNYDGQRKTHNQNQVINHTSNHSSNENKMNSSISQSSVLKKRPIQLHTVLLQVYDIIMKFHSNNTYLGNLTPFSFKKTSLFNKEIKLVQYNFLPPSLKQNTSSNQSNLNINQQKLFGHAHFNSAESDWQFFGYLLHYYVTKNKSPVWISHKMQYLQNLNNKTTDPIITSNNQLISSLLKGKQPTKKQLQNIKLQLFLTESNHFVYYGYKFRSDIIKLIKSRKRRIKHTHHYYPSYNQYSSHQQQSQNNNSPSMNPGTSEQQDYFQLSNQYSHNANKISEQNLHKLQTQRILNRIQGYIEKVSAECEQHFVNYCGYGFGGSSGNNSENMGRLMKEIFLIEDKNRKFNQFKELLPQIK